MNRRDVPRLIVTGAVFALFAIVLLHNLTNEMLIGAMIGALTTAVSFWLGSSKGNEAATENTGRAFSAIEATARAGGHDDGAALRSGDKVQIEKEEE